MSQMKQLQLGASIEDLEKYTEIPDTRRKNLDILLRTAQKLYLNAEEYRLNGDEERAYIMYVKYFNLLEVIRKRPEYGLHKQDVRNKLGDIEANRRIMDKLESITNSLSRRYDMRESNSTNNANLTPTTSTTTTAAAAAASLVQPPNAGIMPTQQDLSNFGLISCQQLFAHTQQKNVLIMDCRASSDFEQSHLTYGWAFNVPEELIVPGMSAGKLQGKLDSNAKALWAARSIKDCVVLMDWNTKEAPPAPNTPIATLLDILKNWDPDVTYRAPIRILEGGYEYFIMMYPSLCTNPSVRAPQQNNNDIDTIDDIEYPSIYDITMKDEIREREFLHPTTNDSNKARPSINRASKMAAVRTYEEKKRSINALMQDQAALLKKAEANDKQLEKAAKKLRGIFDAEQTGGSPINMEQELLYNIMQLESTAEDYKIENLRLRDELNRYKQLELDNKQQLTPKEVEATKKIEIKIHEREVLDEQHERARLERENQLAIARENKRHYSPATPTTPTAAKPSITEMQTLYQQQKQEEEEEQQQLKQQQNQNQTTDADIDYVNDTEDFDLYDEDKENATSVAPTNTLRMPAFDRSKKPHSLISNNDYNNAGQLTETTRRHRDFSPVPGAVGRGLTGLKNLGNTCYMNSILQCLSNTPQLAEYCITDKYKNYISRNNKTKGHIVEEVAALIKILWNGNFKCVASKDLRYVIGQYQQIFRGVEQQDSHEFLTILMDWLHSDLQTLHVQPRIRESITASEKAWFDFTKSKESLILHLFYGQMKSTVKCVTCHKESATYECFSNLSLELPSNANLCYLNQCMDMYFSGELIHGWNCPNCKQKRDAIKKLDISKLPPVLVVHLKRFYADADAAGNSYKKKQNFVRFPLENLDMTPYIARAESRALTPKTYELYGVSNHYGSMESGHYTAFCKSANYNKWFKFDDQIVSALDASNVVSSAAYILFYTWLPPMQIREGN